MSLNLSRGGKQVSAPLLEPSTKRQEAMDKAVYFAWDTFLFLVNTREKAVKAWSRARKLRHAIDTHPKHPSNTEAMRRVVTLESSLRELQMEFVKAEAIAQSCWEEIPVQKRLAESVHEQYGVDYQDGSILGMWHRHLGHAPGAPLECKMEPVVLQFASPSVARSYLRTVTSFTSEDSQNS